MRPRPDVNYEDPRRLGAPKNDADFNSYQHRIAFSEVNDSSQVATLGYYVVATRGRSIGLNPATDSRGILVVHVDKPGRPFYLTPGSRKVLPRFERLYLERPTQPAVPSRSDLYYLLDVSESPELIDYGPLPPASLVAGADNVQGAGQVPVTSLGAAGALTALLAAQPGRLEATVENVSTGGQTVYVTRSTVGPVTIGTDTGMLAELAPGESASFKWTGAIYAWADAAGAVALPWGIY